MLPRGKTGVVWLRGEGAAAAAGSGSACGAGWVVDVCGGAGLLSGLREV